MEKSVRGKTGGEVRSHIDTAGNMKCMMLS